jgi:hypothetical protein
LEWILRRPSSSNELWAALVEQGLVLLLEAVHSGQRVNGAMEDSNDAAAERFPESEVRVVAQTTLQGLVAALTSSSSAGGGGGTVMSRLINALLHSGHAKLRLNIFSGLLLLAGRSHAISRSGFLLCEDPSLTSVFRILWHFSEKRVPATLRPGDKTVGNEDQREGQVFRGFFLSLIGDAAELKDFLRLLLSLLVLHRPLDASPCAPSYPVDLTGDNPGRAHVLQSLAPVVEVRRGGVWTRMVCPLLSTVRKHSPGLATDIHRKLLRQMDHFCGEGSSPSSAEQLRGLLDSLDDDADLFLRLPGDYTIWQEVFSHIADSYLLKASASAMAVEELLAALHIARDFSMTALADHYAAILIRKIAMSNVAAVGPPALYAHPLSDSE